MSVNGRERPGSFYPTPCRKTHDRRRRALQILENRGVGRWRTYSRFALLCEIPCRIEKVRDNLGGGVFRQGSRGCYFGVRSKPCGVATVQACSMPSKSRKPREWPIHPKPDIPGRLPERLLRPKKRRPPNGTSASGSLVADAPTTHAPVEGQGGRRYAAADAADDDPRRRRAYCLRKYGRQVPRSAGRRRYADRVRRRSNDLPDRSPVHEACERGSRCPRDRPGSIATPR